MDYIMVDVQEIRGVAVGDRVTLLGQDWRERITAEEIARWAGTIPYEITCGITRRVERAYVNRFRFLHDVGRYPSPV